VAVDALGNPLRAILSAGQVADIEHAGALIVDPSALHVVADKGHDANAFVESIQAQGSEPVIPPRTNRLNPRTFDTHLYKSRYLVECFFNRIKHFQRIATQYDKLAASFLSFVHLACAFVWLT
jgi:transposase